jgi:hypothetical protein
MTDTKIAPTNLQIVTADVAEKTHVRGLKGMSQQLFDAVLSDPYLGHKIRTIALMGDVITHVDRPLRFVGGRNRCAATLLAAFERLNVGAMIGGSKDGFSPSSLEHCLLAADRVTAGLYHGVLNLDSIDSAGSAMIDHARETLCDNGWSQLPLSDVDYDLYKRKFAGYVPPDPVESNMPEDY